MFAENRPEVFEVGETHRISDFRNGHPGFFQQLRGPFQAQIANKNIGRAAGHPFELAEQLPAAHEHFFRQGLDIEFKIRHVLLDHSHGPPQKLDIHLIGGELSRVQENLLAEWAAGFAAGLQQVARSRPEQLQVGRPGKKIVRSGFQRRELLPFRTRLCQ